MIRLGWGAEFDLIRSFLDADAGGAPLPEGVRVGPGDDCAVLEGGGGPLALSTDLFVEDVHFRRAWLTPEEIGWRAGAAALSDLAAVAAEPVAVLVSLALTSGDADSGWGRRLMTGVQAAAREFGAALVGGDVSRSPGPAVVDVVVAGRAEAPVLRDGARPGDEVWVTGRLGAAGAAVALLEARERPPEALLRAFAHPVPRVREALWLRERAALNALIDLSDGLAGDAGHVAAASGVAVELEAARIPVAEGAGDAAARSAGGPAGPRPAGPHPSDRARPAAPFAGLSAGLALALGAGEDYELCVVAPPGALEPLVDAFRERFALPLTRVGRVSEGEGVWLRAEDGTARRLQAGGFSHFGESAP